MSTENIRLELVKAFIIAGTPAEQIPDKVIALEGFIPPAGAVREYLLRAPERPPVLAPETAPCESGRPG